MKGIPKVVGIFSCSVLLCLGLSNAAKADALLATADMYAGQSEREGGQDGQRDDQDVLKGSHITKSDKEDGQSGLKVDQDKLRGHKSSHTIKGEVLSIEGDAYYLLGQDGTAVRVHTDRTTRKTGNIYLGARVEAEVNDQGHALSIRSTESTDRRNEADRPS
jgi:hypothetical protein